ncbi:MAG: GAF domain-containing protein [Candidatus Puniceispirillaceae bacterium]
MSIALAPRPANEVRRAQAAVRTGLIASPKPELFQIYCDLAKDLTGFDSATFSLFDGEMQCGIAATGKDDFVSGNKGMRDVNNICSYVLLNSYPLLMPDLREDPHWKNHPTILDGSAVWIGYAGFPVINRDNYAIGTLCMLHKSPRAIADEMVPLIEKITKNIAFLLDLQTEQKQLTSAKMLDALQAFQQHYPELDIYDFKYFLSVSAEMSAESAHLEGLMAKGLVELAHGQLQLTDAGRNLQEEMKIQPRPFNRLKVTGQDGASLLDNMLSELN